MTDDGVPVEDLVTAVKRAVTESNMSATTAGRDLRVTSVRLTLHALATATAGGSLNFRLPFIGMKLRIGRTVSRRDTHAIEMTLVPPDLAHQHELRHGTVDTVLVDAIAMIRRVTASAQTGDDPFHLQEGTVRLEFAITADGSVSLGLDGAQHGEVTHTLLVTIAPPTD
ncbi:trypco2 family protein [Streptomyces sp. NPDC015414]|uniref:trypco2 family protein n=1 Tax=Streptomyces sp. NPDC015414 TaxID=3364957 RepID=UPI0036F9F03E